MAYAQMMRFDDAIKVSERAQQLARRQNNQSLDALLSGNEADAHAATKIAHERGHAAHFVVFFLRNARITERIDGNEQTRQSQSNDHTPTDRHAETDIEIEAGH